MNDKNYHLGKTLFNNSNSFVAISIDTSRNNICIKRNMCNIFKATRCKGLWSRHSYLLKKCQ